MATAYPKTDRKIRKELRIFEAHVAYSFQYESATDEEEIAKQLEDGIEPDAVEKDLIFIAPIEQSMFVRIIEPDDDREFEVKRVFKDDDIISHIAKNLAIDWMKEPGFDEEMFIHTVRFAEKYEEIREKIAYYVSGFLK